MTEHYIAEWREYPSFLDAAKDFPDNKHLASLVRQFEEAHNNGDWVERSLVHSEIDQIFRSVNAITIGNAVLVEYSRRDGL